MLDIIKKLKDNANKHKKIIAIPNEKELYNLIINCYITMMYFNMGLYLHRDVFDYCCNYIKTITEQLHKKIIANQYDFTLEELLKYINIVLYKIIDHINNDIDHINIFDIASEYINDLTFNDLLHDPESYFDNRLNGIGALEHTNDKTIKRYLQQLTRDCFYINATDTPITQIKNINDFTINYLT